MTYSKIKDYFIQRKQWIIIVCILCLISLFFKKCIYDYYEIVWTVKDELSAIEGVDHVTISANEDVIIEEMVAHLYLKNNGEIILYDVQRGCQFGSGGVVIWKIGPYNFIDGDYKCIANNFKNGVLPVKEYLRLNEKNLYCHKLPKEIKNIKELVASYNDIIYVLDSICNNPKIDSLSYK